MFLARTTTGCGRPNITRASGGIVLEGIGFERIGVERRRYAVEEIRYSLARLYRGFVLWTSLYGEADEERQRRERVDGLIEVFYKGYLPRSMWPASGTRGRSTSGPSSGPARSPTTSTTSGP